MEFCFVCSCCSLAFSCRPEDKKHSSGTSRTMGSDRRAGKVRRGSRAWHPRMWLEKHEAVAVWSLTSVFDTSNFSSSSAALDPTGAWMNFQGTSQVVPKSRLVFKVEYSFFKVRSRRGPDSGCCFVSFISFSLFIFCFLSGRLGFPGLMANPWTLGCWPDCSYHYNRAQLTPSLHP